MIHFFQSYFRDPRYRTERIVMVTFVPLAVLSLALLAWLLFGKEAAGPQSRPTILTADMVEPSEEAAPRFRPLLEARVALEEGDHARAREALAQPMEELSDQAEALFLEAMIERKEGNLPRALELLDRSVKLKPQDLAVFYRGLTHYDQGNLDAALLDFELAQELNPLNFTFSNAQYLVNLERGEIERVRRSVSLKANLGLANTAGSWILAAAALHLQDGEIDQAVEMLQNSVALFPPDSLDILLNFQPIKQHQNNPRILPFFIQSSTARQR
jgi:tetratricopeptide (TPR) repeat protein